MDSKVARRIVKEVETIGEVINIVGQFIIVYGGAVSILGIISYFILIDPSLDHLMTMGIKLMIVVGTGIGIATIGYLITKFFERY